MATLLEYTNKLDAVQREFETDIAQREALIKSLQLENEKLHKGMNRKLSTLSRLVAKAAEANAKLSL